MSKKPYVAPTVTDHGDAVEQTRGLCGECWETWGVSRTGILPPPGEETEN